MSRIRNTANRAPVLTAIVGVVGLVAVATLVTIAFAPDGREPLGTPGPVVPPKIAGPLVATPCETEDGSSPADRVIGCRWDADSAGNGEGVSYFVIPADSGHGACYRYDAPNSSRDECVTGWDD